MRARRRRMCASRGATAPPSSRCATTAWAAPTPPPAPACAASPTASPPSTGAWKSTPRRARARSSAPRSRARRSRRRQRAAARGRRAPAAGGGLRGRRPGRRRRGPAAQGRRPQARRRGGRRAHAAHADRRGAARGRRDPPVAPRDGRARPLAGRRGRPGARAVRRRRRRPALPGGRMTPTPIVSSKDLRRTYGEGEAAVHALAGVTVAFPAGELTAIMGPSGSGKSTLMHLLAGLDRPTSGTVRVEGTELGTLDDDALTELRREKIGFVFQAFNLLPVLTAEENIVLPLSIAGRRPERAWLDRLVQTVGLGDRLSHRPAELSGGQQQRVALARALVSRPAVIFADEPTGNLDSHASTEVLDLLRRSVDDLGQTVIMVTHDPDAAAYADRVLELADGRVVGDRPQRSAA